ncbi:MAG TPA: M14 family zinc carboxypeptidase [Longimicrobiales bacterium]|nr:M14 family zinc carboxypeptidase [Longimicrobiales bacterium]
MSFRIRTLAAALLLAAPASLTAQAIPTPASVLGHEVGADFVLATWEQSMEYFDALAAASDRVLMRDVGTTSFGRTARVAFISSAENLANLDRHVDIAKRLANPAGLTDAEARDLAREGRAIVHIDGGMHATEVAHAQHTIQLAYDLVTGDDDPEVAQILDEVILLLWPSINPDGQTLIADWYNSNVGTRYEAAPAPFLYQKYIGHDNNRDGYMINMIESRFITRVSREYEPQIIYNHHQTSPFPTRIWIPPFAEPISPRVHPLMWRTVNLMGMNMSHALEERGMRGATHMGGTFDNWYPGFMDHAQNFHNIASFLTETALAVNGTATPQFFTISDFPSSERDLRPGSLYSSPWEGGWWRIRDAIDYMLVASFSVLDFAAKFREDVLYNRYQAGRDVATQYADAPPYAYFIPQDQRDPVAAVELLRRLAFNGIDVHTTTDALTVDGISYPAGTWVIRMDQPNANFVAQLFDVQEYPDLQVYPEGPPDQPYDVAGWTLPYQFGVDVHEARTPVDAYAAALEPVIGETRPWDFEGDASPFDSPPDVGFDTDPVAAGIVPPAGTVTGGGSALILDAAQNNTFKAIGRALEGGATVRFVPGETSDVEGEAGTTGYWAIEGLSGDARSSMVSDLHLRARRGSASGPEVAPRIGLYRPWSPSMDEGWTRWLLEAYDVPFTSLYNPDVRAGDLIDRYDVIVVADIGTGTIVDGWPESRVPGRYAGGIGDDGVRALDDFVAAGGTLVTINGSSHFAIDRLHLPVRDVVRGVDNEEFSLGGSVTEILTDPSHPVMSGMEPRAATMIGGSPVFTTEEGFEGRVLAKYATEGSPLMSGYLLGEEYLQGHAAAIEVKHGEGQVVLLGMRPQWRAQPFGSFRILFNAVMYTDEVADAVPSESVFWEAPATDEEEDETGR